MTSYRPYRAQTLPNPTSSTILTEEPLPSKSQHQNTVTCIYQANVAGAWRNVTILWTKNIMNHSLCITVDSLGRDFHYNCKVDIKPWHFWSKKGYKSFEVDGISVEVYWDLRSAKFCGSPEPISDYYVALVSDEEIVLLMGDNKRKAYKRTKTRSSLVDAVLLCKKENVFAKKSFTTRARFDERRKESDIVVESSTSGLKDPEMWISIDGIVLVHVKNLQWKFRGNQTVVVNKTPIQVFWDVHDWLFGETGGGFGLFLFKPGPSSDCESEMDGSPSRCDHNSDCSSGYYSTRSTNNFVTSEFCLGLYTWKIE